MRPRRHPRVPMALVAVVVALSLSFGSVARAASPTDAAPARSAATTACGTPGAPTAITYLPNITKTLGGPLGWDTPFYVQNAGPVQTTVEATFYRFSDGAPVACRRTSGLGPGTSMLDDPDLDTDLAGDTQYSVVLKSYGAAIVATVDQVQGTGATTEALAYSGFTSGAATVYLPNVTRRFYGYDVPFIVQNLGSASATVSARFVSFDGSQQLTVARAIDPGKSKVVDPDSDDPGVGAPGLVDGTQYAVTLTASQPIAVVANAHNEAVGPVAFSHNGLSTGATTVYAPYAVKIANGLFSPIVVQNVGTATADATLAFAPLGGSLPPQIFTLRAIPAGGSRAFDPRFTLGTTTPCATAVANACLGAGEYSLRIDSTSPVAAVVLPNSATTAAGYLAASALQPRSVLPIVMRNVGGPAGWNTSIFVQRGTATQATIRYYALGSNALVTSQVLALSSNGTKLDPRTVPGLRDDTRYAVTIDGNGGTLTAVAHQRASTGGDTSMMYEGFGTASPPITFGVGSVSVSVASDVVIAGASEQIDGAAYDQYGVPLPSAALTWTVAPATLGTISASGVFTAGAASGSGVVTATSGGVSTPVSLTVQVPARTTVAGLSFLAIATSSFDLYTEASLPLASAQRVLGAAATDVLRVQSDYAQPYPQRPAAYVLPDWSTFSAAVQGIGGVGAPSSWAAGECVCSGDRSQIFINWQAEAGFAQITNIRHELTHAMERDLAPAAFFPTWFDEGNARLEEMTVPGTDWFATLERSRAASMAAQGSLFTLADLTSPYTWAARSDTLATYEYAVAGQAVSLLRSDVGMSGEIAMLRAMGAGVTFEEAYAAVAGRPFSDFASAYAARIRALAPGYPGIATAGDAPTGSGVTFVVYGLPSLAPFTLSIVGSNGYHLSGSPSRTADGFGIFYSYLAGGWPPATYTITATWSGGTVSTAVVKTSSLDGSAVQAGEPVGAPSSAP